MVFGTENRYIDNENRFDTFRISIIDTFRILYKRNIFIKCFLYSIMPLNF